jgi:hypothetical protein
VLAYKSFSQISLIILKLWLISAIDTPFSSKVIFSGIKVPPEIEFKENPKKKHY